MRRQSGFTLFELTLVICIIALLATIWMRYAGEAIDHAERAALETVSRSFASSMGSLRGKWILENPTSGKARRAYVDLDKQRIFVNQYGWPTNTTGIMAKGASQTPRACLQLWQAILQSPQSASLEGEEPRGTWRYHISTPDRHTCRYELAAPDSGSHYFDYDLNTGRVDLHVPALNRRSDG